MELLKEYDDIVPNNTVKPTNIPSTIQTTKSSTTPDIISTTEPSFIPTTDVSITTTTALPKEDGQTCPVPDNLDGLTQNQFWSILTRDCRYDKVTKPPGEPVEVGLQIDVRHLEAAEQLVDNLRVHVEVFSMRIILAAIKSSYLSTIQLYR